MTHILMVVTSHGNIQGEPMTGVWFTEFSEPYQVLIDRDIEVTAAMGNG